ncbi:MAG: hypothetical protein GY782_09765 [Gammaproteobacteria bacterium]|nr:hypothetical protein [Gammaproteobacteria bacterium]
MTENHDNDMPCPCRSGQLYRQCCEPLIRGQQHAKTPLQLMRSRYSAYALENMDYIEATMRGKALEAVQKIADKLTGANRPRWYRLEIIDAPEVGENDTTATVEFIAYFRTGLLTHKLHELSYFEKINNQWFYVDGEHKNRPWF